MQTQAKNNQVGFTLIELLVVISIIALLSSIVLSALGSSREKAQMISAKTEMNEFVKAIEIYKLRYGNYPTCGDSYSCAYNIMGAGSDPNSGDGGLFALESEMKNKKIFNKEIHKTFLAVPKVTNVSFEYIPNISSDQAQYLQGMGYKCGDKSITQGYYMYISLANVSDAGYLPILGLEGSYWSKEYVGGSEITGVYCSTGY